MNHGDSVLTTREIALHVKGLVPPSTAILQVHVEQHVGGSRYSHAYRVRPVNNDAATVGLIPTATYCLKVYHIPYCWLCPRDTFIHMFSPRRQLLEKLDRIGRAGALWHLLIRRAATRVLGDPDCVPKIHATFCDRNLRAFGTMEEWAPGRPWLLEVDDAIFDRPRTAAFPDYHEPAAFSSEYTAKRFFMARFSRLLQEMGADGLAERYSWRNWRSAQRVVLRAGCEGPYHGLAAVDFEPARSDADKLRSYLERHADDYLDLKIAADELLSIMEEAPSSPGSSVMPTANSALAHLLWLWSRDAAPLPPAQRVLKGIRRFIRGVKKIVRLTRDPFVRSNWLIEQVHHGLEEGRLTEHEAKCIREQVNDPDVQLYLKCFFVHLCTLPITPLAVIVGSTTLAYIHGLGFTDTLRLIVTWIVMFTLLPLSPGSITRGLYVAWVAWHHRQAARLRIALALSFWRYVGFLSFPLQMIRTFPALSRFAAAIWVARLVRMIPHYGKRGSLLEHRIFDLLFNLPLSIARLYRERQNSQG